MKTLKVFGWAVIFTATLLLAACASHTPKVADTDTMSGPDVTMTQSEEQQQAIERRENELTIQQAWLDEREMQLAQRASDVSQQENALAINQAWLNERENQVSQRESDVDLQENALAINQAWLNERETLVGKMERRTTSAFGLAGADMASTKVEAGRCYASVVSPAVYKTVAVTKPIEAPKGEKLPTLYQTVTEKVKVADEQMRWEEILCEDRLTEYRVIEIQRALSRSGYNPGPIDGIVGRQTMAAVNNFQKDSDLTVANYLTIETVKALDANF